MKFIMIISMLLCPMLANAFDPMAPPGNYNTDNNLGVKAKKKTSKLRKGHFNLLQIVVNDKAKNAIIDGHIVNEGDYIKNALVKSISKDTVILVLANKEMVLTLTNEYPKVRHHEAYEM